jgi:hypothetical protein
MSRYDGLNLPQLFDLMHPLVEPAQIPLWPQTAGWTVLLVWGLVLMVMLSVRIALNRRRNRYRRDALEELRTIAASAEDNTAVAAAAIAGLLKRTALAVFPRSEVAGLHGRAWAEFLIDTSGNDPLVRSKAPELTTAAYRSEVNGAALVEVARRWIKQHRIKQHRV